VGPTAGQDVFLGNFLSLPGIKPWIAQSIVSSLYRLGYITNYEPFMYVSVHDVNQELTKDVVTQLDDVKRSKIRVADFGALYVLEIHSVRIVHDI
jgi:hypothetical protein